MMVALDFAKLEKTGYQSIYTDWARELNIDLQQSFESRRKDGRFQIKITSKEFLDTVPKGWATVSEGLFKPIITEIDLDKFM